MSTITTDNEASSQVGGGNVWQPVEEKRSKFLTFLYKVSPIATITSLAIILTMLAWGFVQILNSPAQNKNFYTTFLPYEQGWEMFVIVPAFIIFFVSFFLLLDARMVATILTIFSTFLLAGLLMAPSAFAQSNENDAFSTWLQETQGLNLLDDDFDVADLTNNKPLMLQGDDEKIYSVVFKDVDDKISVVSKIEFVEAEK
jgi:hypothetical protein